MPTKGTNHSTAELTGKINFVLYRKEHGGLSVRGELADGERYAGVLLYILPLYRDEKRADYGRMTPAAECEIAGRIFEAHIPREKLRDVDTRYGVVFTSKVAAVAVREDGGREVLGSARYLDNPEAAARLDEPLPVRKSIKGVGILIPSDLERLGVQYTTINVLLWDLLTLTDHGDDTIPFGFEGEMYYFKRHHIEVMDNTLTTCDKNGISVLGILIMKNVNNDDPDSPARYYAHPETQDTNAMDLVAVDMTNLRAVQYYKAIIRFLTERYTRPDRKYGRFEGYIVGNEIGTATCWNYMGIQSREEYIDQYWRWLRLTSTLCKQAWSAIRVYASFDHFWCERERQPDFVSFYNKDVLDGLVRLSEQRGDFDWNIAWHPYPQDIYKIDTWNDPDCGSGFDTRFITFKNLEVLSRYLQLPENRYRGQMRRIILSEQGFTSGDNAPEKQELQAAAYAYAYYKALLTPGVDIFSMNGHVDNGAEMGLSLGLWTAKPGTVNQAQREKQIYPVFRDIDREGSLEMSRKLLPVIARTREEPVADWSDVLPEFDEAVVRAACSRPRTVPAAECPACAGEPLDGIWTATDGTGDGRREDDGFTVRILARMYDPNTPKDYKGCTFIPKEPLDLSGASRITVTVRTDIPEGPGALEYRLRFYSGDRVAESAAVQGRSGEETAVAADIAGWAGAQAVDRIKIWVRAREDVRLVRGKITVTGITGKTARAET